MIALKTAKETPVRENMKLHIELTVCKVEVESNPKKFMIYVNDENLNHAEIKYQIKPDNIDITSIGITEVRFEVYDNEDELIHKENIAIEDIESNTIKWYGDANQNEEDFQKADILKNKYKAKIIFLKGESEILQGETDEDNDLTVLPTINESFICFETDEEDSLLTSARDESLYPIKNKSNVKFYFVLVTKDNYNGSSGSGIDRKYYHFIEDGTLDQKWRVTEHGGAGYLFDAIDWNEEIWDELSVKWKKFDYDQRVFPFYSAAVPFLSWSSGNITIKIDEEGSYLYQSGVSFKDDVIRQAFPVTENSYPQECISINYDPESTGDVIGDLLRVSTRQIYPSDPNGSNISEWAATYINVYFGWGRKDYDQIDCKYAAALNPARAAKKREGIPDTTADGLYHNYTGGLLGFPNSYIYSENISQSQKGSDYTLLELKGLPAGTILFYDWDSDPGVPPEYVINKVDHVGVYLGNNEVLWASTSQGKVIKKTWDEIYYSGSLQGMWLELSDVKIFVSNPH